MDQITDTASFALQTGAVGDLSETNTRRVKRVLFGLFEDAVGKDVDSGASRRVKMDWDTW